jgi:alpha-ketoglutarate-dependent taurine dioxygenase
MGVDDVVRPRARDLTPALGAEIDGVDLTEPLSDETIGFLREVFDDRGLLLFRRTRLAQVQQYVLCEVMRGRERPSDEQAEADAAIQRNFYVSNRREGATAPIGRLLFHADGVWTDEPFEVLSLYAEEMEPNASATLFASAVNGWETMPDALRARIEGREAIQVGGPEDLHEQRRRRFGDDIMQTVRDGAPSFTLPVVRPHPRTGRMALLISENHAKEIVGLPLDESDALLDERGPHPSQGRPPAAHVGGAHQGDDLPTGPIAQRRRPPSGSGWSCRARVMSRRRSFRSSIGAEVEDPIVVLVVAERDPLYHLLRYTRGHGRRDLRSSRRGCSEGSDGARSLRSVSLGGDPIRVGRCGRSTAGAVRAGRRSSRTRGGRSRSRRDAGRR